MERVIIQLEVPRGNKKGAPETFMAEFVIELPIEDSAQNLKVFLFYLGRSKKAQISYEPVWDRVNSEGPFLVWHFYETSTKIFAELCRRSAIAKLKQTLAKWKGTE